MDPLKVIFPFMDALNRGKIVRKAVAYFLVFVGISMCLAVLYALGRMFKLLFDNSASAQMVLGAVAVAVLMLVFAWIFLQLCLYRASSINKLGDSEFTMIPIVSIIFRFIGEVMAFITLFTTIVVLLAEIVADSNGFGSLLYGVFELPFFREVGRYGGTGWGRALSVIPLVFAEIFISYLLSELVVIGADMARSLRKIAANGNVVPPTTAPSAAAYTPPVANAPAPGPVTAVLYCPSCGASNSPADSFCMNCGTKIQ